MSDKNETNKNNHQSENSIKIKCENSKLYFENHYRKLNLFMEICLQYLSENSKNNNNNNNNIMYEYYDICHFNFLNIDNSLNQNHGPLFETHVFENNKQNNENNVINDSIDYPYL